MRTNRRFVALLTILLLAILGGLLITLVAIRNSDEIATEVFGDPTKIIRTTQWIETAIHATETAKAYTATPTKEP